MTVATKKLVLNRFQYDLSLSEKASYLGIQETVNPCLTKKCKPYPNQEKGIIIPYIDLFEFVEHGHIKGLPYVPKAPKSPKNDNKTKLSEYKEFYRIWQKEYEGEINLANLSLRFRFDKVSGNMPKYISNAFSNAKQFYYGGLVLACLVYLENKKLAPTKENILSYFAKIKVIYLTEGEFKTVASGFCGVPIVGLGGINNIPDFAELKQFFPNLEKVVMLYDKDCFDKKLLQNNEYATENDSRQINFLASAKTIQSECKKVGLKCLFGRVKPQYQDGKEIFDIKGLDDLLQANWSNRMHVCNGLKSGLNGAYFEFFTPLQFIKLLDTLERNNRFKAFGKQVNRDGNYLSSKIIWDVIKSAKKTAIVSQTGVGKSYAFGRLLPKLLEQFEGRIVIVMPRRKLLRQFRDGIKDILEYFYENENISYCEVFSDSDDKSELTFKTAKIVLVTPHSFHKISEHLDYDNDFFFVDEFDLIDKQGKSFDKDFFMKYCSSLEKMQNVLLSSATPNYFILRHLNINSVYNFNVKGQEKRNHFLLVKPQKGINKASQSTEIIKRELDTDPTKQFLLYVNDFSEAKNLKNIFVEKLGINDNEISIAGTNDHDAREIQENESLTAKITIVTSWCLYGINLRNKNVVSLMLANQNHNLPLSFIIQFAGRLREMGCRKIYLLLNDCKNDLDIENEFYFACINENRKVEALNNSYVDLSSDFLNYAKHLFINELGKWELNKISLSLEVLEKQANNTTIDTFAEVLKPYGKIEFCELDKVENISIQNEPTAPQSEIIREFCEKKQISEIELFQNSNQYSEILPQPIKNTVFTVGKYANDTEIHEIADNLNVLDSTRTRGDLFRDLKVRAILRTNPSEKSVNYHLKHKFLDFVKGIFDEIVLNGNVKFSSQDLKDAEISLNLSHVLEKQKCDKSVILSVLRAFFDVDYKAVRIDGTKSKYWIISRNTDHYINATKLENQNIYNTLFQKSGTYVNDISEVKDVERKREFLQSLELGTTYTKSFLKENGITAKDLENLVFDYSEKRIGSKICVVLNEIMPF